MQYKHIYLFLGMSLVVAFLFYVIFATENSVYIENYTAKKMTNVFLYIPGDPRLLEDIQPKGSLKVAFPKSFTYGFVQVGFVMDGVEKILDVGEVSQEAKIEVFIYRGNYSKLFVSHSKKNIIEE